MTIFIKNRFTGDVIYQGDHPSMRAAVLAAIKSGANLSEADLWRADLSGADLSGTNLLEADLSEADLWRADLSGADLSGANLSEANLSEADLSEANLLEANLSRANLSEADLSEADLSGADLSGANLSGTRMPGFADTVPQSLKEAAEATREWLRDGHWLQGKWIDTPTSAYAGDCLACLHGAAVYCGGEFGPELSRLLTREGYGTSWNDEAGRSIEDVVSALDSVISKIGTEAK